MLHMVCNDSALALIIVISCVCYNIVSVHVIETNICFSIPNSIQNLVNLMSFCLLVSVYSH